MRLSGDKLKVLRRLDKSFLVEYIIKRFTDKYKLNKEDFGFFKDTLIDNVKYIIFEDYNLPYFHWRIYWEDLSYEEIVKDYFSDCEEDVYGIEELGVIYDVREDKFVKVEFNLDVNVKVV